MNGLFNFPQKGRLRIIIMKRSDESIAMLTDRFDPVDEDSLNEKAEVLACEREVMPGLDDSEDGAGRSDQGTTGQGEGSGIIGELTSRIARVLPKG